MSETAGTASGHRVSRGSTFQRAWEVDRLRASGRAAQILEGQKFMFTRYVCGFLMFLALNPYCRSQENAAPNSLAAALGVQASLNELSALRQQGQGASTAAVNLRQDILENIMQASFDLDSVLARIQVEIAYTEETRILLENRQKRRESRYSLASFLAGGVFGTTGSALGLSSDLSHAGNVVGVVGGGSVLALALIHAATKGPTELVQSPLNMLAQPLGMPPNRMSTYPDTVLTLMSVPGPSGGMYVSRLPTLWVQLHRLQVNERDRNGSSVQSVTSDADQHVHAATGEFADREAMLQDLNASLLALRSRLGDVLDQVQPTRRKRTENREMTAPAP